MRVIELFQKELISLLFALILALIYHFFRARAKLVWATPHGFTFLLSPSAPAVTTAPPTGPQPSAAQLPVPVPQNFNIFTGSIVISNTGRDPATGVEVTFNWRPDNYNIWPVRPYDIHLSPDNRFTLKFANLAPKEFFQIELISPNMLPLVLSVRSRECVGKQIGMRPMVILQNWIIRTTWGLMFLGVASIIYLVIKLATLVLQ
jgi:hypothetical protein